METQHLPLSGSTLTKKVRTESDEVYLSLIHFCLSSMSVPGQIVSPLWLFAQGAQPLDSSYSAHNVHNALGNCFFPLPLKSHHFTRLSASVLLFIFKGLNQDKYSQVKPGRPAAWEVPWKSVELTQNCFSCMKEQEECGWVCERGKSPGGGTDSGLAQTGAYSRDHSASLSSLPLQRLGGEFLWNHTITENITTLWKHNSVIWIGGNERRKGWSFTADTRKDRNI